MAFYRLDLDMGATSLPALSPAPRSVAWRPVDEHVRILENLEAMDLPALPARAVTGSATDDALPSDQAPAEEGRRGLRKLFRS